MVTSRSLEETGSVYDVGKNGGLHKSPTSKEICEMHVAERTEPRAQDSCRGGFIICSQVKGCFLLLSHVAAGGGSGWTLSCDLSPQRGLVLHQKNTIVLVRHQ